ncbi:MauE/DoxX family redox-associated membrane protein [Microbacterium sp. NPDC090218]
MSAFLLPLIVFLAAVFAASAIGKLRSADRGRAAFTALHLPVRNPNAAAVTLIAVEAVVALGLLVTTSWLFVGFAAATLLLSVGLLLAVARAHRLGATDDCGCFGDWLPTAIGPRLVVRNLVLTVIAACALAAALVATTASEPVGIPAVVASGSSARAALGALASGVLIAAGVWSIARASAPRRPADRAPSASPFPRGTGALLLPGTAEVVDVLAPAARARLLVFVAPGCHACATALASLRAAEAPLSVVTDLYVVQSVLSGATSPEPPHSLPASARFALDVGGSVGAALDAGSATPVAALIGTDGVQAGPLAVGSDEVEVLIDSIRALADVSPA